MCELSVANLQDDDKNRVASATLLWIASNSGNHHGTGMFSIDSSGAPVMWKTAIAASNLLNLGKTVLERFPGKRTQKAPPIFGHVRDASKGIAVSDSNAHPFAGDRFILAHNGRLWAEGETYSYTSSTTTPPTDEKSTDEKSAGVESDSLRFLKELEKQASEHPDRGITTLCNDAMSKFTGKFAFLFFDKLTHEFYVARGTSATLYKVDFYSSYEITHPKPEETEIQLLEEKKVGFIISTNKNTVETAAGVIMLQLQIKTGTPYVYSNTVLLDTNTLYKISGKELIKVGEVKENTASSSWSMYDYSDTTSRAYMSSSRATTIKDDLTVPIWKYSNQVAKFLDDNSLSINDLDTILFELFGKGILGTTPDELETFIKRVIPVLSGPKRIRKYVSHKLKDSCIRRYCYRKVAETRKNLQFPWTLNEKNIVMELIAATNAEFDR